MNLQFLKYFVVLAEELHFSKAAEKLSITQPPLSLAMKNLEEELGVSLFNRNTKKVELTKEGIYYLGEVRKIIAQIENSKRDLLDISNGFSGTLKIGLSPSLTFRGVIALVESFEKRHPNIQVTYYEMPLVEQIKNLNTNNIDIGFCNSAFPIFEFNWKELKKDCFCLCVHEGHPLYETSIVDTTEINANDLIIFDRAIGPSNYDLILRICGVHHIRSKFIVHTWGNAISLVFLKKGIAVVPQSMQQLKMPGLRFIPLAGDAIYAKAMMLWNKNPISTKTQIFQDYLASHPAIANHYFEEEKP